MPEFIFRTSRGRVKIDITGLIVAGWTGRDAAAVQHHIDELALLGVPAPTAVPLYYQAGAALLTQADSIATLGTATSGEAEPMLVTDADGDLWLGLGSDHTDRELEAVSVAKSKQICPKPIADTLWRFDDVTGHLDQICLRSEILEAGSADFVPYQNGTFASIRPLADLIAGLPQAVLNPGTAMLCGTLTAMGGVRPASRFRMQLYDPVLDRSINCTYTTMPLPVIA